VHRGHHHCCRARRTLAAVAARPPRVSRPYGGSRRSAVRLASAPREAPRPTLRSRSSAQPNPSSSSRLRRPISARDGSDIGAWGRGTRTEGRRPAALLLRAGSMNGAGRAEARSFRAQGIRRPGDLGEERVHADTQRFCNSREPRCADASYTRFEHLDVLRACSDRRGELALVYAPPQPQNTDACSDGRIHGFRLIQTTSFCVTHFRPKARVRCVATGANLPRVDEIAVSRPRSKRYRSIRYRTI
jgi:hypothetical protein